MAKRVPIWRAHMVEPVRMIITLVLNRNAGILRGRDPDHVGEELADVFRAQGHVVTKHVHAGVDLATAIERICREKACDAIVVGGGDGTVSAAAAAAAASGLVLGVLPLGTMNLFARSLGIPLGMRPAAEALAAGKPAAIDIGEVNGRLFIHHVTLGLHPHMIKTRDGLSYSSAWGKVMANVHSWWIVLGQPPRLNARIRIDGEAIERRTAAILVSNNALGEGHLPYADDLNQGQLALYLPKSHRWHDLVRLTASLALGEIAKNGLLEFRLAEAIEISLPEPTVQASIDGEIVSLATPLRCRVRKGGLTVLRGATG